MQKRVGNVRRYPDSGDGETRLKYLSSNISKLHPAQVKLIELTAAHSASKMLSGADSIVLLSNMLRFAGAKKCLDIGVYTGYSSLSWALSIPDDGKVVACDINNEWAQIGAPQWKEAGVDHKIDLRIAPAAETLQSLVDAGESGTYDFMFMDADKTGYDTYYEFGLKLLRPQGIIAIDNAMLNGKAMDPEANDEEAISIRELNKKIKDDSRVTAMLLDISDGIYAVLKN